MSDLLYAIRLLRRNPGYSLVVITVLAVGIAANLIAFGLFKAVALAPLAGVERSGSMLFVGERTGDQVIPLSYPDYLDLRHRAFPGLAASGLRPLILGSRDGARLIQAELVTGNYFDVLHVRVAQGRTLIASDAARPGQPVVVLSDGLWRRAFGADPAVIGTTIRVNHYPLTVVGIADPTFRGAVVGLATDLFVPITLLDTLTGGQELDERNDHWAQAFIGPNTIDRTQAEARAAEVGRALAAEYPIDTMRDRAVVVPIWRWPYGAQTFMLPASALIGAVGILLLVVVCANVAGLVLVRSLARRSETAARLTLGATRGRIMRQLTIESLVLAVPAAVVGFILPALLESFLSAAMTNVTLPLYFNTNPDRYVVGATVLLAMVSALIYGVVPAIRLSRADVSAVLKDTSASGGRTPWLRGALVVAQIAGALVLLVGTALILRTLDAAQHANAGFDPRGVTWASFDARAAGVDEEGGRERYTRLLDAVRAEPGVQDASLAAFLPLGFIDWMNWDTRPEGQQVRRGEPAAYAANIVATGYFRTMRIPVIAGRDFDESDDAAHELRLIVNETFARRFWGSPAAAIGRHVDNGTAHRTIVGVVRDIKYARLDEASRPYMYAPLSQNYDASLTLQVRGGDTAAILARIRADAQAIDPSLTVLQSGAMADTVKQATSIYETLARMLTLIGLLAVAVSALGVYGLVAYAVKQKAQEIGIRTALGATRAALVGHFLRHGVRLALIGAAVGMLASLAVSRLMSSLLFGVAATDLTSFALATAVVVGAAIAASLLPAWKAASTDPVTALRQL